MSSVLLPRLHYVVESSTPVLAARTEAFLALYLVSRFMTATPIQDLLLHKACLNELHANVSVCAHLDNDESLKNQAEQISSTVYRFEMPLYVNILCSLPEGLSGGLISVFTAVHSVAAVTTGVKGRRARFFGLSMVIVLFITLGGFLGGQLYGHYGSKTVLGVSLVFASAALLWAFFVIEDLVRPEHATDGVALKLRNLFQVNNLREGFKSSIKARPRKGRAQVWCLFGAICCVVFDNSSKAIDYYFAHKMYSWSVAHYTTVKTVSSLACLALYVPLIYLFLRVFKISDPAMALVGVIFATAQMAVMGLAYTEWLYYVSTVFAFLSSFDSVVPLLADVLLTGLFNVSITFLPGLPYLVAAGISGIAIGLMGYVTKVHRKFLLYEGMPATDRASAASAGVAN
ncbi:hypothetical protein MTO96_031564 [Rhipicephalus appendiculatus]